MTIVDCWFDVGKSGFGVYKFKTGCDRVGDYIDCFFCMFKNSGEFAYGHNGFLVIGEPTIFKCGPFCKCHPTCHNRVSQKEGAKEETENYWIERDSLGV
ncbi:hypothetical protein Tsubulata_005452 [Turnera subulata]|uniref:Pre-SET domain-containing protein n=1 Tax=Turnera subulata TaxID=218843 RepID=A0A9Q0GI81_9ROSI|nr:hypothetical protein Tsubulata_005452 [Turnera subulata]